MSFSTLRPLARSALRSAVAVPRTSARSRFQSARGYASAAESGSGGPNYLLYGLLGAAGLGGAYYATTLGGGDDATKIKSAAMPDKVDYQKVYNRIADILDADDCQYNAHVTLGRVSY